MENDTPEARSRGRTAPLLAAGAMIVLIGCGFSDAATPPDEERSGPPIAPSTSFGAPHRVIITTDIGGTDPDDMQSMAHALLYADVVDIVGLVSSPANFAGDNGTVQNVLASIEPYERDYPVLSAWGDYPTPDSLCGVAKQGASRPAPAAGYKTPTEASRWIIQQARRDDPRPLYVLAWGGTADIAQAVHDDPAIKSKIRVYSIAKQDRHADDYLLAKHPDLWWIRNLTTFRGMYLGGDQSGDLASTRFPQRHVKPYGAMGAYYPLNVYLTGGIGPTNGMKMGDTPSFMYLLDGDPNDPSGESWGGRFVRPRPRTHPHLWSDVPDARYQETGTDNQLYKGARTVNVHRAAWLRDWQLRHQRTVTVESATRRPTAE